MHLKDRGTGNSHDNTDLRYHQYKSDPVSQTALLGLRRPQGPCPSDSYRQLKLVGRHTLDAGSAVATFRLHCITSLPANQCLLSHCTHAPPPFATDIASCHSLPREPLLLQPRTHSGVGGGSTGRWAVGSWMDIKATGNRSLSRKVLLHSPHGSLARQEAVFCSRVPPPKTQWVGRWAARQYNRTTERFQQP